MKTKVRNHGVQNGVLNDMRGRIIGLHKKDFL